MADASEVEKKKRFRSPPYPAFDLGKAAERITLLEKAAQHHQVGVTALTDAWGMKSADGQVWRTAAALIQYGLLTDSGTGKSRKFQVSDIGRRIARDNDPDSEKRKEALKAAALRPMIHKVLWEKYQSANDLADTVIRGYLTLDRLDDGEAPYSVSAATEVIASYRSSLSFAGLTVHASLPDDDDASLGPDEPVVDQEQGLPAVKVGDYVRWTSAGVEQFKSKRVDWLSDDGAHLRVFGSGTGIPTGEVDIVEAPKLPLPVSSPDGRSTQNSGTVDKAERRPLNATANVTNGRLQISADVGPDEIAALKSLLSKYEEILRLLS